MKQTKSTEIKDLGEFGLIEYLTKPFENSNQETIKGVGDDASVYQAGDKYVLLSTDMLLEGVHFDLSYTPLQHLGYKAIVVNVSDILAMNGIPKQVTVNIALSNRFSVEAAEALYQGILTATKEYKIDLVGGDTTTSKTGLIISISIIGETNKDAITYRNTANEHDILCVSGDLGAAYIGLQVLEREKQEFLANPNMNPQLEKYNYVVERQLRPKARTDVIQLLNQLNIIPTSMIDISDGLSSETLHLCHQSKLGATIYEDKLPIKNQTYETAAEFKISPSTCVLNGGDDYELLFTLSQKDYQKIKDIELIHLIGYMQSAEKGKTFVTSNNQVMVLQAQGWKHF